MSGAGSFTERLNAALEGRYRIERELGEGGMVGDRGRKEAVISALVAVYPIGYSRP